VSVSKEHSKRCCAQFCRVSPQTWRLNSAYIYRCHSEPARGGGEEPAFIIRLKIGAFTF
jgi:hypothetical protein